MTSKINALYEDNDIVAFDKPFGLVVNRSSTYKEMTLQDIIETTPWYIALSPKKTNASVAVVSEDDEYPVEEEFESRSGIVHRIDKETSGVVLVAKNMDSFAKLKKQFMERTVSKKYVGIVLGKVAEQEFEVNAPVSRNPENHFKFAVVEEGRPAVTKFKRLKEVALEDGTELTTLEIVPITGRTHQIRVHLAAMATPIVHDTIYCSRHQLDISSKYFSRMMLHANMIKIMHPTTNEELDIVSALPSEFSPYI